MFEGAPPPDLQAFRYVSAACTDVGTVRKVNEDALLERRDLGLWAVADGMGGHRAGDYASNLIVRALDGLRGPLGAAAMLAEARSRLTHVNRRLRTESAENGGVTMGSTVVVLMISGRHYCCLWAGDSRIYLVRDRRISMLTHDHSHVQEMVDRGLLTPAEARNHPQGNVVTRAVGADDDLKLDKINARAHPHDLFLLCSDGLTKEVADEEIARTVEYYPLDQAARALVQLAVTRGASDNVTAVLVELQPPDAMI
jgi:serine/threonine protein phosphatase PrpC